MGITTNFRSVKAVESTGEVQKPVVVDKYVKIDSGVEVPYTEYEQEHSHSYLVDHYKLGDHYDVFEDEIQTIDSFIKSKIANGDIANTKKAVEKEITIMEKINNIKDDERTTVRIGVLKSYINFLTDTRNIKRYANY
jgi:hypothetical protein